MVVKKKAKKAKREKGVIVHGTLLPYFTNGKVSLFTQELGKIVIEKARFEDLTTEGGVSNQWYTWRIKPK